MDVMGVGENLPFPSVSFDLVLSPEGYSFLGACCIFALFLDSCVENRVVRKLVDSAAIPVVNLAGERMDHWCGTNTSLTNNYFAFAQK